MAAYDGRVPFTVRVEDLEVVYEHRVALSGVSFDLPAASTLAVIGPNGSGKSTLLRAIAGLVHTTRGQVDIDGASVAFVLQSTDVDRDMPLTVRDTVAMARYPSVGLLRPLGARDRAAVAAAMAELEVTELAGRQLQQLSGGQRQRVLMAQGVAQGADVLLLDEPVTGLDVTSRAAILEVIERERAAGRAVVMTTHNFEDARLCDRVLLLATRVVALGPPEAVITEENLRVAFGGRVMRTAAGLVVDDPHHSH